MCMHIYKASKRELISLDAVETPLHCILVIYNCLPFVLLSNHIFFVITADMKMYFVSVHSFTQSTCHSHSDVMPYASSGTRHEIQQIVKDRFICFISFLWQDNEVFIYIAAICAAFILLSSWWHEKREQKMKRMVQGNGRTQMSLILNSFSSQCLGGFLLTLLFTIALACHAFVCF